MTEINPDLKYMIRLNCDWWEAQEWCKEHVGEFDVDWYKLGIDPAASLMGDHTTTWFFKDNEKMLMFALKWSK